MELSLDLSNFPSEIANSGYNVMGVRQPTTHFGFMGLNWLLKANEVSRLM